MQSFKQYLTESSKSPISLGIMFSTTCKSRVNAELVEKELKDLLSKKFELHFLSFDLSSTDYLVYVRIGISDNKDYNKSELFSIGKNFIDVFENIHPKIESVNQESISYFLDLKEMPKHFFEFPSITISFEEKIPLKDINKKIECRMIAFSTIYNITGNVLSLLKIKPLTDIYSGLGTVEWFDIIKKYLKSKDILACQDELIENGLKEYAKF